MNSRALILGIVGAVSVGGCAAEKVALNQAAPPEIVIESIPRGARVRGDEVELGVTPLVFRAASATSQHRLSLARVGFRDQEIALSGEEVRAHSGQRLYVPMRPAEWDAKSPPIDPEDAVQLARAGADLSRANRCAEALQFLRRAIQIDPRVAAAHKGMGVCYGKLGKGAEALAAYKQYLLFAPDAPDAGKVQEIVSRAQGDIEVAPSRGQ